MSMRADYDPRYFLRFLIIGIGCIGVIAWCIYDLRVKYPAELERAEVYWQKSSDYGESWKGMERTRWREIVARNEWPTAAPDKPDKIRKNIQMQYLFAIICALVSIPCLIKWFRARGTWVEGSETGLTTSWGQSFQYKDVVSIDKRKWEKKGIARIQYQDDGKPAVFVFDDFKFHRATMSDILTKIESGLTDDQITGADRETVIKERKAKEAAEKAEAFGESAANESAVASETEV